jgi:ABC-type Fe3+ transport system permease subunit
LLNQLAQIVGVGVVGLGGVTALAFAMFRFFGEKWLGNKFDERLS